MLARKNPFRTEIVLSHRYQFADGDSMDALTDRFRSQHYRGAIVGPKGRGKTMLLEDFCAHLGESGEAISGFRLNQGQKQHAMKLCEDLAAKTPEETILVIDGAEQLGWLQWRKFVRRTRRFRGLLVTTHRAGRLPELIRCQTSVELLRDVVQRITPEKVAELDLEFEPLFAYHSGNLRECLRSLYDRYAKDEERRQP